LQGADTVSRNNAGDTPENRIWPGPEQIDGTKTLAGAVCLQICVVVPVLVRGKLEIYILPNKSGFSRPEFIEGSHESGREIMIFRKTSHNPWFSDGDDGDDNDNDNIIIVLIIFIIYFYCSYAYLLVLLDRMMHRHQ
jgi:hypothetical protein